MKELDAVAVYLSEGGDLCYKKLNDANEIEICRNDADEDIGGQKCILIVREYTGYGITQTKVEDHT